MIHTTITQAKELLVSAMKAKVVPMLWGSPGVGKSAIVQTIADEYNLWPIDLRISQLDPVDFNGFPHVDKEAGRASYLPMDFFPLEGDPLPEGKNGWLLFCDEINAGDRGTQKAAYKLILDRMVGMKKLHPNVAIMGAGNLATDNALVEEMGTALQSRLIHINIRGVDTKGWVNWATDFGIDHHITAYINFKPTMLYDFDPLHTDNTFPCPRTWEFADRIYKVAKDTPNQLLPLLAGTVGEGAAREFIGFTKIYGELPSFTDICNNPKGIEIPKAPSTLFALMGMIAHNLNVENIEVVMEYIERLPIEFQTVCLSEAIRRNRKLRTTTAFVSWATQCGLDHF
jgi:MoxR-like ATPase